MTYTMRYFLGINRPVSLCQLVSLAITCFLLGWITSRTIFLPTFSYIDVIPPACPTLPPSSNNNNDESSRKDGSKKNDGVEEHLFRDEEQQVTDSPPPVVPLQANLKINDNNERTLSLPKLFCMVITAPNMTQSKAVEGVKATWGRRCDKLVFISSQRNDSVPTINCNCTEGYSFLWGKVKSGLVYVHQNFNKDGQSDYDWFLKADDDTYVIMENMKAQLRRYNSSQPVVLGRRLSAYVPDGYMAGGPGYILSKTALKILVETALLKDLKSCRRKRERGIEDVEMGMCLHALNITFADTRDPDDTWETFIQHNPQDSLVVRSGRSDFWKSSYNYYKTPTEGSDCCSDRAASFHRMDAAMMKVLEYFIYRFQLIK